MQKQDFLVELGFLGFVTRLKRISDAMLHDGRRLYKELGIDIEPNWYVVFKLLKKHKELTVTEIADKIGFAHPSAITIINKMIKAGYLESDQCSVDNRRRLIRLTEKAENKLPEFEKIWAIGVASIKSLFDDVDALEFLDLLETRIGEKGFKERTLDGLAKKQKINIFEFEDKYAEDFARLNYEWVEAYFEVEEHDREQLDDPINHIINKGGQIFFASIGEEVVGTVALIFEDEETFELAKMGVTSKHRGFKIGDKLMLACLEYARKVGKNKVFLESNTKLVPAISLYRKFGFKEVEQDKNTPYERSNIKMELILDSHKDKATE